MSLGPLGMRIPTRATPLPSPLQRLRRPSCRPCRGAAQQLAETDVLTTVGCTMLIHVVRTWRILCSQEIPGKSPSGNTCSKRWNWTTVRADAAAEWMEKVRVKWSGFTDEVFRVGVFTMKNLAFNGADQQNHQEYGLNLTKPSKLWVYIFGFK